MKWLFLILIFTPDRVVVSHEQVSTQAACEIRAAKARAILAVPHPFTLLCLDLTGEAT